MAAIHISGGIAAGSSTGSCDLNALSVWDSEFFSAVWREETDAFFSLFHVQVEQLLAVRIDISMIILAIRGTADQIGVILGIGSEHILVAVSKPPLGVVKAKANHRSAVFQHMAVSLVETEHIKYRVELGFELRRLF